MGQGKVDVIVLGAGPAGSGMARGLVKRGCAVVLVDPAPDRPWPNRYGAWTDELDALGLRDVASQTWPRSELVLPNGGIRTLERGYASIDGARLRRALTPDVPVVDGRAERIDHDDRGSRLRLADGRDLEARVVIDATGHRSAFVDRSGPAPTAWQVAYGMGLNDVQSPYPTDAMRFMDWRPDGADDGDDRPTFLYAMPEGSGGFFEETQLIGTPAMTLDQLEHRLLARLARDGVQGVPSGVVERCRFPMDPPLPVLDQRTLGFGAAASLVHPATGYLLMRTLRAVDPVSEAIVIALTAGASPERVVREAWRALWPASHVDAARLLQFGARTLLAMNRDQIGAFYEAFFSTGDANTRAYLSGDLPADELARIMLHVFGQADVATQWRLTRQGLGDPWPLLRGVARIAFG